MEIPDDERKDKKKRMDGRSWQTTMMEKEDSNKLIPKEILIINLRVTW